MDERSVGFRTKNGQCVTLEGVTFLRRWLHHRLPPGFVKIRHYGLMSAAHATMPTQVAREAPTYATEGHIKAAYASLFTVTIDFEHEYARNRVERASLVADLAPMCARKCARAHRSATPLSLGRAPPPPSGGARERPNPPGARVCDRSRSRRPWCAAVPESRRFAEHAGTVTPCRVAHQDRQDRWMVRTCSRTLRSSAPRAHVRVAALRRRRTVERNGARPSRYRRPLRPPRSLRFRT